MEKRDKRRFDLFACVRVYHFSPYSPSLAPSAIFIQVRQGSFYCSPIFFNGTICSRRFVSYTVDTFFFYKNQYFIRYFRVARVLLTFSQMKTDAKKTTKNSLGVKPKTFYIIVNDLNWMPRIDMIWTLHNVYAPFV